MEIETVPIVQIRPYWQNPRRNDAAVASVKASIEKFGFNVPIVVDAEHVIVAGHTRHKALLDLGVEEVPVVIAALTPEQATEYRIADNRTHELSEWDWDKLGAELRTLPALDDMQVFFDVDLEGLLREAAGEGFVPPTAEALGEAERGQRDRFGDRSDAAEADMVEVLCPECGEAFYLSLSQVQKEAGLATRREAGEIGPVG